MRYLPLLIVLSGCASGALPPERCTPSYRRAYLSACELAVEASCEAEPRACELNGPELCKEALQALCPEGR